MQYFWIFSFSTSLALNCYDYIRFSVYLWVTYDSLRWTGVVWYIDPSYLGEPGDSYNFKFLSVEELYFWRVLESTILPSQWIKGQIFGTDRKWTCFFHIIAPLEIGHEQAISYYLKQLIGD